MNAVSPDNENLENCQFGKERRYQVYTPSYDVGKMRISQVHGRCATDGNSFLKPNVSFPSVTLCESQFDDNNNKIIKG